MIELRPVRIILVSFYCFLVGLYLFSLTANTVFNNAWTDDLVSRLPVMAAIILAFVMVALGIGILYYSQICWKALFFLVIIFIANVVSFAVVIAAFWFLHLQSLYGFYHNIHVNSLSKFLFCVIFAFSILVLYQLTRKEMVAYFGDLGDLAEPF